MRLRGDIPLEELILRLLDSTLTDDEASELDRRLQDCPEDLDRYCAFMMNHTILYKRGDAYWGGAGLDTFKDTLAKRLDPVIPTTQELLRELTEYERSMTTGEAGDSRDIEAIREYAQRSFGLFKTEERRRQEKLVIKAYRARRRRLTVGLTSLAAMLMIALFTWLASSPPDLPESVESPFVATLVTSQNAQWEPRDQPVEAGTRFRAMHPLFLTQGLAQVAFADGAEVILQAPCRFELKDSGRMFVSTGVASALVRPEAIGFVIETPSGKLTDYGTEFGVIVHPGGMTETHVYEGKVRLDNGPRAAANHASRILEQGQACTMDMAGQFEETAYYSKTFIRVLPAKQVFGIPAKRFDLTDALVGGNGFGTGEPNRIVDLRTGDLSEIQKNRVNPVTKGNINTMPKLLPFVDYVFLPDGGKGAVQVSSSGHIFPQCPDTDGRVYPFLSNSALNREDGTAAMSVLNGKNYGTRVDPVISLHANAGVTFDLQAVRTALPGVDIQRFTTLCGISESAGSVVLHETGHVNLYLADFWVLVDGQIRFSRRRVQVKSGGIPVSIPLTENDRFLTLVVTDGGDGFGYDWGMFAEPALELK